MVIPLGATGAVFSQDRLHRYTLWRRWRDGNDLLMVIGLNPSTADEVKSDPTVTRCMGYARRWGYAGLLMTNLFAYRATDPKDMRAAADPMGPENVMTLLECGQWIHDNGGIIVAAWGNHGLYRNAAQYLESVWATQQFRPPVFCLEQSLQKMPKHPLYLRSDIVPQLFWPGVL